MKNKILNSILAFVLVIACFIGYAKADDRFSTLPIWPGTAGVNWTIPYKTSDILIGESSGTNWTELDCWDANNANATLNWTNRYRIQAGATLHIQNIWSGKNVCAIRGQNNGQEDDIFYTVSS